MRKRIAVIGSILLSSVFCVLATAQDDSAAIPEVFLSPGALVADMYPAVSTEPGKTPDWEYVRSHFDPDAVVVIRASRTESKKFDVDGFLQDFIDFYKRIDPTKNSFKEEVLSLKVLEYGNIAQCYVVYAASVPSSGRPPQRGLDSWQLMKRDGRWWIVSVVNESELAAGAIPEEVFDK